MPCPSSFSRWAAGLRGRRPGWPSPRSPTSSWSRPTAPVIVLGAILASPVAYLLATAFGSRGTFDDTLVAVGLATCIATLFSLVPDFVMGLITAAGLANGASWAEDLLRPSPARTPLTPLQPDSGRRLPGST